MLFIVAYILVTISTPIVVIVRLFFVEDIKEYLRTCAIGFDQAGGSILYSQENFTISSYTYYLCSSKDRLCWFNKFIDLLFGKDHCKKSYEWEIEHDDEELKDIVCL